MLAPTVREPLSSVAHDVEAGAANALGPARSPQSKLSVKVAVVSALDGSAGSVSASAIGEPSSTEAGAMNVAVGATLSTETVALYSVAPPSLSRTDPFTARGPLSL